jgi:hypothetical protein
VPEADLWTKMIDDIKNFTSVVWLELYPCATLSAIRNTVDWFWAASLTAVGTRSFCAGDYSTSAVAGQPFGVGSTHFSLVSPRMQYRQLSHVDFMI